MKEVLFLGTNVVEEVSEVLNQKEETITSGMTETELKAYKLGVSNTLSTFDTFMNDYSADYVIHMNEKKAGEAEEFTYENLSREVGN